MKGRWTLSSMLGRRVVHAGEVDVATRVSNTRLPEEARTEHDIALPTSAAGSPSVSGLDDVDWPACAALLDRVLLVAQRFPREHDYMYCALLDMLRSFKSGPDLRGFLGTWVVLVDDVLASPQWLELLFPEQTAEDPALTDLARASRNRRYLPTNGDDAIRKGSPVRAGTVVSNALFAGLLEDLSAGDPGRGPPFLFLSRFYCFRDLLVSYFVDAGLKSVQRAIFHQCHLQRRHWRHSYAADYPYQGMARLGISGIKPTEERLATYEIERYLRPSDVVLDIGSNNGLWALALAARVGHVDGLEFNPYLVAVANIAKEYLGVGNASFIPGDFVDFETSRHYDVVFSLANHCTIDGNLAIDFEQYVAKLFSLLKPDGFLFFESHNVFGPGAGGPGDDGDLDAKFDVAERYFEVVQYKMTRAYVPAFDIDKLFVIMRRREDYAPRAARTLRLAEARCRYAY